MRGIAITLKITSEKRAVCKEIPETNLKIIN